MDIFETIGYILLNNTDITDVVGANIYHGLRPVSGDPCINYFEVGGYELLANNSYEQTRYQISCRATTAGTAQDLARMICVLFQDMREGYNNFGVQMVTVENKMLLPEPNTDLYHVPVDIRILYSSDQVS